MTSVIGKRPFVKCARLQYDISVYQTQFPGRSIHGPCYTSANESNVRFHCENGRIRLIGRRLYMLMRHTAFGMPSRVAPMFGQVAVVSMSSSVAALRTKCINTSQSVNVPEHDILHYLFTYYRQSVGHLPEVCPILMPNLFLTNLSLRLARARVRCAHLMCLAFFGNAGRPTHWHVQLATLSIRLSAGNGRA